MSIRIGIIGLGKISVDQHLPALRRLDDLFVVAGGVSPTTDVAGVEVFDTLDALLESDEVDAVAINTPPQVRYALACKALAAGKDVLLEKPPGASVGEVQALARLAEINGRVVYSAWHSQHAPAVQPAKAWLKSRTVREATMVWCEDVRRWHPGQTWIWQAGGLGVFDPGINGLSILTRILPADLVLHRGRFEMPGNCQTPIAAKLEGAVGTVGRFEAHLDFLQTGAQTWSITVATDDGELELAEGGATLVLAGEAQDLAPSDEYLSIYRQFFDRVRTRTSEIDLAPLQLAADAALISTRVEAPPFVE